MEHPTLSREEIALRLLASLIASSPESIDDLCPDLSSPASNEGRVQKTEWLTESAFRMADVFIQRRDKGHGLPQSR